MKAFLLSFTTEYDREQYHYYLVYAENIDSAYELLSLGTTSKHVGVDRRTNSPTS